MPKTAVGLFENEIAGRKAVGDLEMGGLLSGKIQILGSPLQFKSLGAMSSEQLEFEVECTRELGRIGATRLEVEAYLNALRRGRSLVLATSSDKKSDVVSQIMNQSGAFDAEELISRNRVLPPWFSKGSTFPRWV